MRLSLKTTLAAVLLAGTSLVGAMQARAEEFTIVAVHSLTGGLAFLGVPATNAMKLAVEEANQKKLLGKDTIRFIVFDNASNSQEAITAFNRAALQEKALIIMGPSDSTRCAVIGPQLNDLKVPTITTCQSDAALPTSPYLFKSTTDPLGAIRPLGDYAVKKLGLKRVAAVFLRDNDGQIANARAFLDPVAKSGVTVVGQEGVLSTDTDYAAVATKLAAAKPDGVYIGANAEQAANIVTQLRTAGLTSVKIFGSSSLGVDYIKTGGPAVDNTFMTLDYDPGSARPLNVAFAADYRKRFGTDAENYAAVGYSDMLMAIDAIRRAQPSVTREHVRETLLSQKNLPVVIGNGMLTQMPNRVPEYGIGVFAIQGGKIVAAP